MEPHPQLFGLEVELDIVLGLPECPAREIDFHDFIRSTVGKGVWERWDYGAETPGSDVRGYSDTASQPNPASPEPKETGLDSLKNDLVLTNGARLHSRSDRAQYSTPECSSFLDLTVQDRAGDRILMACGHHFSVERNRPVYLCKANTDHAGHRRACHENYLISRPVPWAGLVAGLTAFLVTRQIFTGAGKYGYEAAGRYLSTGFQISQMTDFLTEVQGAHTRTRCPLISTRDEPHANPELYRRLHLVCGDSNLSSYATRLKMGTTSLVLEALTRNPGDSWPRLQDPLLAAVSISRDERFRWGVLMQGGRQSSAVDVQRVYLERVRQHCDLATAERRAIVADWEGLLDDLETDWARCGDRLDWVAKRKLMLAATEASDPQGDPSRLKQIDRDYHRLDPFEGLFFQLEQQGQFLECVPESRIREAMSRPPATRAALRGLCIEKFPEDLVRIQWEHIVFKVPGGLWTFDMQDLLDAESVAVCARQIRQAQSVSELRGLWERQSGDLNTD